jgi:predicted transcriptional regulator
VPLKIDLGKTKFRAILKPYQILAMKDLWTNPDGRSSRDVYDAVNEAMEGKGSISRASIINTLNAFVDDGVLSYHEITGKGGHRRIYKPNYNEKEFKQYIAETVLRKLLHDFPEETRIVLQKTG